MFSSRRANVIKTPAQAEAERKAKMKTATPEKIAKDRDERADQHRNSTKETVALAQEVMAKARDTDYVPGQDAEWLFETAKSLAGSVLSQADPTD